MDRENPVILLVEDSDSDAMLIEQAFRKARVRNRIVRLACGRDAISYLSGAGPYSDRTRHPLPLFVLLDLTLPDLSGYEILRWLRQARAAGGVPTVVVTGSAHPDEEATAAALGANAFFRKGLVFENLVQMVQAVGANWSLRTD